MEEKKDEFVLLNEGVEQEEEGSCYSWPMLYLWVVDDPELC